MFLLFFGNKFPLTHSFDIAIISTMKYGLDSGFCAFANGNMEMYLSSLEIAIYKNGLLKML